MTHAAAPVDAADVPPLEPALHALGMSPVLAQLAEQEPVRERETGLLGCIPALGTAPLDHHVPVGLHLRVHDSEVRQTDVASRERCNA